MAVATSAGSQLGPRMMLRVTVSALVDPVHAENEKRHTSSFSFGNGGACGEQNPIGRLMTDASGGIADPRLRVRLRQTVRLRPTTGAHTDF